MIEEIYYQEIVKQLGLTENQLFNLNIEHFTEEEGMGRDEIILQYFGESGLEGVITSIVNEFRSVNASEDLSFLDLGTGSGSFFVPVIQQLHPNLAAAFDATPLMLELTEQKLKSFDGAFTKIYGDMEQIVKSIEINNFYNPQIPRLYDQILSTLALHHIPNTSSVLSGIASVMKPNGKAVIIDAIFSPTSKMAPSPEHAHDGFDTENLVMTAKQYFDHIQLQKLDIKCYETASKSGTELFMMILQKPNNIRTNEILIT